MASGENGNSWFVIPKRNPEALVRLFCFPYAGGTAHTYRTWPEGLSQDIEVCAVQIPGRGIRIHERPFTDLKLLVRAISGGLHSYLDKPFAFFGHSMGAVMAFELASVLQREGGIEPLHLFVSGGRAPGSSSRRGPVTFDLPHSEFVEHLRRLNGTPKEVLEHPELMQLMLPLLRADFQMVQTFRYTGAPLLGCPITAFGGWEDREITVEEIEAWGDHTTSRFSMHMMPGDHFFLQTCQQKLLRVLDQDLSRCVMRAVSL